MQSIGISDIYYGEHIFNVAENNNEQEINIVELVKNLHIPTSWNSSVMLSQYIDTPMHLLFQGIVKSVIEFSFNYLKDNNKKQAFKDDLFDYMYHIKLLQCDFLSHGHIFKKFRNLCVRLDCRALFGNITLFCACVLTCA